jgi:prepilin-type N-terminal cleavage/methylation domain-containing protein
MFNAHKNTKGFTLIEMIIIIVIVAIGVVPLMNMFYGAGLSMGQADFVTVATELGQRKMDGYIQSGYASASSGSGTFSAPHAAYSWTTTATPVDAGFLDDAGSTTYKKVEVTVSASGNSLKLTTVLANHS